MSASGPRFEPVIASVAAMLAEPSRAAMLQHLMDGRRASATDLAAVAGISRATASAHLAKLVEADLLRVQPRGRHRYYELADERIAALLEAMAVVSERSAVSPAWRHPARARLRFARCCYRHLAGQLGVQLFTGLLARGALATGPDGLGLTTAGEQLLAGWGLAPPPRPGGRRSFARPCHDWSEGVDHLAGELAERLLDHFIARAWLQRGSGRELLLTPPGQLALGPVLQALAPQRRPTEHT